MNTFRPFWCTNGGPAINQSIKKKKYKIKPGLTVLISIDELLTYKILWELLYDRKEED